MSLADLFDGAILFTCRGKPDEEVLVFDPELVGELAHFDSLFAGGFHALDDAAGEFAALAERTGAAPTPAGLRRLRRGCLRSGRGQRPFEPIVGLADLLNLRDPLRGRLKPGIDI